MLDQAQHRFHLQRLLKACFEHPELSHLLGFKGGTAAYFFYDLPRFSVDLDFDVVATPKPSSSQVIVQAINEISGEYEIKDFAEKANTLFWLLSYTPGQMNIKVEISTRIFANTYDYRSFFGTQVRLLVRPDMIAHKLVAILDRPSIANRDLFDAHFFLNSVEAHTVNVDIIKERTGLDRAAFFARLIDYIPKHLDRQGILNGLGELVDEAKKTWVKAHLVDELIHLLDMQRQLSEQPTGRRAE